MNAPIRVRLTAWYAVSLAVMLAAFSAFLVVQLSNDLRRAVDDEIHVASAELAHELRHDAADNGGTPSDFESDDFESEARPILAPSGAAAQLLDARGRLLQHYGQPAEQPLISPAQTTMAQNGSTRTFTVRLGQDHQRYRVQVSTLGGLAGDPVLVTAVSLGHVEDSVSKVITLLLVAGPLALASTGLAGYMLTRRALRPIERIAGHAQAIDINRLDERVEVPQHAGETQRLASTFNAMLDRIESGVMDKRRLIGDASHELRTPLAVMRTELDVSLRADGISVPERTILESVREEVDGMTRLVDNLLTLAQADEGRLELLTSPVSPRRIAEAASHSLTPLAVAKRVQLVIEGDEAEVNADPGRLQLVLTNLLENAITFSPFGGLVRVTGWSSAEQVGITVTDHGPGIADADQQHLFDRFYRVDSARGRETGGGGLGLAICEEVMRAHGGRIWVDSQAGSGSAFSLALPRSQVRHPSQGLSHDSTSAHAGDG